MSAMKRMKRPPSEERMRKIASLLDADCDGRLNLNVVRRVRAATGASGVCLLSKTVILAGRWYALIFGRTVGL